MRCVKAPVGLGFDASTYVTPAQVKQLAESGYEYRIGYLRRDKHVNQHPDMSGWPVSLSVQELHEHLNAGVMVGAVQFARFHGLNYLSAGAGKTIGEAAAWNAEMLGLPKGIHLWLDAEWNDCPTGWWARRKYIARVLAYCAAWCRAVVAAGYRAAVYEGFWELSARQWYSIPKATAYWLSAMRDVKPPRVRGCCMYQGWEHSRKKARYGRPPVHGVSLDTDFSRYDRKGERFYLAAA